jgi:predicted MFS family arabinose efflux permease
MRLRFQLLVFMVLRTILNTMHRMVYPFLTVFARGLGVEITTISYVVTARSFFGMFAPVFGSIADQRGRKFGMLAGILLFTLGMGAVALQPNFVTFSIAVLLAILGKYLFDPAMQAYFGDRIPYERRGTALAVTEAAWSMSFIAGVPLMGFLIAGYGWDAPFPLLAGLGLVMFAVIWRMVPYTPPSQRKVDSVKNIRAVLTNVPALAGISIAMWASASNELVNLIFGVWLEDSFGLKIAALAGASAVIGLSELSGEGLVALTTDRLGKPRALALGLRPMCWPHCCCPSSADGTRRIDRIVPVLHHVRICAGQPHPIDDRGHARGARHPVILQRDRALARARDRRAAGDVHLSTLRVFPGGADRGALQWFCPAGARRTDGQGRDHPAHPGVVWRAEGKEA